MTVSRSKQRCAEAHLELLALPEELLIVLGDVCKADAEGVSSLELVKDVLDASWVILYFHSYLRTISGHGVSLI